MLLRVTLLVLVLSAGAMAGSRPVCPGPAAVGDAHCHARVITDKQGNPVAAAAPSGYGSVQFQTAYSLPSSTAGSGQMIGIVDAYDDPNIEKDLGVYSSQYGLPVCTTANGCFKKVNQRGSTSYPRKHAGWSLEISLGVEIVHAICPKCKILLVEADSNSFANLLATPRLTLMLSRTPGVEASSRVRQLTPMMDTSKRQARPLRSPQGTVGMASSTRPPRNTLPRLAEPL
jgi:hypothetical protein